MKFHQIKTDIAQTTEFEIAEVESAKIEFFEIAEIQCFVDAVFCFIVAIALFVYLIDFRVNVVASIVVSIVEIANVSIAVKQINAFVFVLMRKN